MATAFLGYVILNTFLGGELSQLFVYAGLQQ
jgi:hypothetical protein